MHAKIILKKDFQLTLILKKIKIIVKNRLNDKILNCIKLKDLIQIAIFKFPNIKINRTVPIIWGTAKSIGLSIV